MSLPAAGRTGRRVAADVKCRRCVGIVPPAAALNAHITHGERLLAVGDKAVIPRLIGRIVRMARHLICGQCMRCFSAAGPSCVCITRSQQEYILYAFPRPAAKRSAGSVAAVEIYTLPTGCA